MTTNRPSWLKIIAGSLLVSGICAPVVDGRVFEVRRPDVHDIGPLSRSPDVGDSEIIWTLEPVFSFFVPRDSASTTISLFLHAPYGGYAKDTDVTLKVGTWKRLITVRQEEPIQVLVRRGQALIISVPNCVVPSRIDPQSVDNRELCVGISRISYGPAPITTRFFEILW
jgi:hypothetical protein